jgi:hypothetical protein
VLRADEQIIPFGQPQKQLAQPTSLFALFSFLSLLHYSLGKRRCVKVERPLCLFQQQTRKTHTSSDFIQCSTFIYATGSFLK